MTSKQTPRQFLNSWFPIVVRYAGVVLLVVAAFERNAALIPAATGMIFFKTIVGSGERE